MKVDNFRFSWEHNLVTRTVKGVETQLRQTICKIWRISPLPVVQRDAKLPLHQAGVVCSTEDTYIPELGRRKSLTRVLQLVSLADFEDEALIFMRRDFRTRVWEEYRTLTKEPRWTVKKKEDKDAKATSTD